MTTAASNAHWHLISPSRAPLRWPKTPCRSQALLSCPTEKQQREEVLARRESVYILGPPAGLHILVLAPLEQGLLHAIIDEQMGPVGASGMGALGVHGTLLSMLPLRCLLQSIDASTAALVFAFVLDPCLYFVLRKCTKQAHHLPFHLVVVSLSPLPSTACCFPSAVNAYLLSIPDLSERASSGPFVCHSSGFGRWCKRSRSGLKARLDSHRHYPVPHIFFGEEIAVAAIRAILKKKKASLSILVIIRIASRTA